MFKIKKEYCVCENGYYNVLLDSFDPDILLLNDNNLVFDDIYSISTYDNSINVCQNNGFNCDGFNNTCELIMNYENTKYFILYFFFFFSINVYL